MEFYEAQMPCIHYPSKLIAATKCLVKTLLNERKIPCQQTTIQEQIVVHAFKSK